MDFSSDSFPSLQASQTKKRSITHMDDDDGEQAACCHHDRWFIVQSTDSNKAASKLSPFVINKALNCSIGTVKTVRCFRQGDILIEVSSATQSCAVTKLNNLAGCPVTASPHRTLNTYKGIIRCKIANHLLTAKKRKF